MRVYIAGPYTKGDVAVNVRAAIDAANVVLNAGHDPYVPHLTHFWHLVHPRPYREWIEFDLRWLDSCDAILRPPGESEGADREIMEADRRGMPVYELHHFTSKTK